MFREIPIILDVATGQQTFLSTIEGDIGANRFNVSLMCAGQVFSLADVTYVTYSIETPNGGTIVDNCEIVSVDDGQVRFVLPALGVEQLGNHRVTLEAYNETGRITFCDIIYSVYEAIDPSSVIITDPNYPILLQLISDVSGVVATEAARVVAENLRQEAIESFQTQIDAIVAGGTIVADSVTNGNIVINGAEVVVYAHPTNHVASVITQDSTNRFVTDAEKTTWNAKQASLISGTNIKTINGSTVLGSGDLTINGGTINDTTASSTTVYSSNKIESELADIQEQVDSLGLTIPNSFIRANGRILEDGFGNTYVIKGINTGDFYNSVPYTKEHTNEMYLNMAVLGFNTIRVLMSYKWFEDEASPYVYKQSGWDFLDAEVSKAKANGIRLILDMHYPQGGWQGWSGGTLPYNLTEYQPYKDRFVALWKAIATRYSNVDTIIGYGLVNEPTTIALGTEALTVANYNTMIQNAINAIRTVDTNHILIIQPIFGTYPSGSNTITWNHRSIPEVTDGWNNIMYELHYYGSFYIYDSDKFLYRTDNTKTTTANANNGTRYNTTTGGWQTLTLDLPNTATSANVTNMMEANWVMWKVATGTNVYYDNLKIDEYTSANVFIRNIANLDFNTNDFTIVSSAATKGYHATNGVGGTGCLYVEGDGGWRDVGIETMQYLYHDTTKNYKFSLDVKVVGTTNGTEEIYLNCKHEAYTNTYRKNKAWLSGILTEMNNRTSAMPVYMGELGLPIAYRTNPTFQNSDAWFRDFAEIIGENNINFSWHQIISNEFGLYTVEYLPQYNWDWSITPIDYDGSLGMRNENLYSMFNTYFKDLEYTNVPIVQPWDILAAEMASITTYYMALRNSIKGNTVCLLGDSITDLNGNYISESDNAGNGIYNSDQGYFSWANVLLKHRMKLSYEGGYSGIGVVQMIDHLKEIVPLAPSMCIVMGGINDVFFATPASTIFSSLQIIYNTLLNAGITVVACTITPSKYNNTQAKKDIVSGVNSLIKQFASNHNDVILCDWHDTLLDTSTGSIKASYSFDDLHPNALGAAKMGEYLANILDSYLVKEDTLIKANTGVGNLLTNGFLTGTDGSGIPTGYYLNNGTNRTNIVSTKVARTDGYGEWQQLKNTVLQGLNFIGENGNLGTDFNIGDKVYFECEFETDGDITQETEFSGRVQCINSGYVVLANAIDMRHDYGYAGSSFRATSGVFRTPLVTIPANTTKLQFYIIFAGAGTIRIGRCAIKKG